ncbi:MAG TPA: hypothetical protein VH136_18700 [Trebonia sp.]|nr:hypothetical protein [Trebonia sp.]
MTSPAVPWQEWAPPLDPPTDGGLPADQAAAIADQWWDTDPHMCAAIQWEAYAAMLPPAVPVAQVTTGAQNVSYSPASAPGQLGAAMARAAWHRSFVTGELVSVRMHAHHPPAWGYYEGHYWPVTEAP